MTVNSETNTERNRLVQTLFETGELRFRFDPYVIDLAPVQYVISKINDDFLHVKFRKDKRGSAPQKKSEAETIKFIESYSQYAAIKKGD